MIREVDAVEGEKMAKSASFGDGWSWWICWMEFWGKFRIDELLVAHMMQFPGSNELGGPRSGKIGIATTGHLGRVQCSCHRLHRSKWIQMWKYICESPICESTFIHGNFRSIQRISVMMQNKRWSKKLWETSFSQPQGIQCFGMVGLGFVAGSPRRNISWKGIAFVQEAQTYERMPHVNFPKLGDTSRYTINISSTALISDCGVEQDHGEHVDFDERLTTTQQRYTPGLALLWCFACWGHVHRSSKSPSAMFMFTVGQIRDTCNMCAIHERELYDSISCSSLES